MDGKSQRIGRHRAIVLDVVRLAAKVPTFPVERWFDLSAVAEARNNVQPRISWVSIFARAYGLASLECAELRQCYVGWPLPRVYQSPYSVISVAITRATSVGERLFFGRLKFPEEKTLGELQSILDRYVHADVEQEFKQQLRGSYAPMWLRRLGWFWRLQVDLKQRARRLGTGGMSVLASYGVYNRLHPCFLTSSLSYGPMQEDGRVWVTLQCDHRVLDGVVAARALNSIDDYLHGQVLGELRELAAPYQKCES